MKFLTSLLLILFPIFCFSKTLPTVAGKKDDKVRVLQGWQLVEVKSSNKNIIGYVYHTSSYVETGLRMDAVHLRMVCTTKPGTKFSGHPIILMIFDSATKFSEALVSAKIDGNKVASLNNWKAEDNIMYREISESKDLITAMSNGETVSFDFDSNNKHWGASFSIREFAVGLKNFETGCGAN